MSEDSDMVRQGRESIRSLTRDPVTKLLLGNSQLSVPQFETLLANSVSSESHVKKGGRRFYRPSGRKLSRGAFNRTLIQAENNVMRSIYTILLLGYVGLYDSPSLQPFIELSDTIQSYMQQSRQAGTEDKAAIDHLKEGLTEGISSLARRQTFKDQQ
jgi:hypothetical protein